jgi:hypothetical protein
MRQLAGAIPSFVPKPRHEGHFEGAFHLTLYDQLGLHNVSNVNVIIIVRTCRKIAFGR